MVQLAMAPVAVDGPTGHVSRSRGVSWHQVGAIRCINARVHSTPKPGERSDTQRARVEVALPPELSSKVMLDGIGGFAQEIAGKLLENCWKIHEIHRPLQ